MTGYIVPKLQRFRKITQKAVNCPVCSRKVDLILLDGDQVYYGGCFHCMISVYSAKESDDLAWIVLDKQLRARRWRRVGPITLPGPPFQLLFNVTDLDNDKAHKMIDLVFDFLRRYHP